MKRIEIAEPELAVLRAFWREVQEGRGWLRHGVRGWRHPGEIAYLVQDPVAAETVVWLKRVGLVTASTVHLTRRQVIYRISAGGAGRLVPGHPFARPQVQPGRATFFLRRSEWQVLLAYRSALTDGAVPRRWGELGWLRANEARSRADGYACTSVATAVLARVGLVEQRREPALFSRVSAAGLRLRVVDRQWAGEPGLEMIEVGDVGLLRGIPLLEG